MKFLRKRKNIIICILLVVVCSLVWHVWLKSQTQTNFVDEYVWNSTLEPEYIEYGDAKYTKNTSVETILLGGVDQDGPINLSNTNGNGGQADMLLLLVINNNTKTVDKIQINRDTMTPISILNEQFVAVDQGTGQIALAHAYGNGGTVSCNNTVDAVENLFFGIEIDKYLFLNMGAVPILNDFFGGVKVHIEDDFSNVDPTLVQGETITLNGTQAANFVRARTQMQDPTNENRMNRHRQYLDGLIKVVRKTIDKTQTSVADLYHQLYDYMSTSLSASEMTSFVVQTADYTYNDTIVPQGVLDDSGELVEFYPDDDALMQLAIDLFYVPYGE